MSFLSQFTLKHRHILTSAGNIRLRYIIMGCLVIMAGIIMLMRSGDTPSPMNDAGMPIAQTEKAPARLIYSNDPEEAGRGLDPYYTRIGVKPELILPPQWTREYVVQSGDTLGEIMERTTLTGDDYMGAMTSIRKLFDPKDLMPGQKIVVHFQNVDQQGVWQSMDYILSGLESIVLSRDAHGDIIANKATKPVFTKTHAARTTVTSSLYADLSKAGVPDGIINNLIKAYSWSIDFQRDIWGGETVEVLYETSETEDESYMRSGRLLYARLDVRGKDIPMYYFEKEKGYESYYEPSGQSVKKALLKTPVDGARISSTFGRRRHPVLGYTKMHKGLDFAAPTGTPIFAAGDGVVQRANRFSSFGNYIKIRHNSSYSTAYAHLHKFGKGVRSGARVKQGQVIGYVGTTGRSTGPHLHYEVHVNGRQVNPQSVKLPLADKLTGKTLSRFKAEMATIKSRFNALMSATE